MDQLRKIVRSVVAEGLQFEDENKYPKKGDPGYIPAWHDVGRLQSRVDSLEVKNDALEKLISEIYEIVIDADFSLEQRLSEIKEKILDSYGPKES